MTSEEFHEQHPLPWKWVELHSTIGLMDAKGQNVAYLHPRRYAGVPHHEVTRHIQHALKQPPHEPLDVTA